MPYFSIISSFILPKFSKESSENIDPLLVLSIKSLLPNYMHSKFPVLVAVAGFIQLHFVYESIENIKAFLSSLN